MLTSQDKLPNFLIIGAMKAGTTTLYRDLLVNPAVFLPAIKEPHNLLNDDVLTSEGKAEYAALFRLARPEQICGEASTGYSKLPDHTGVPQRAMAVLGPNLKIIYLVREPVARIISHHYHSYSTGVFGPDINREVREKPSLLDYTRYAMQIQPWIETFGRSQVLILVFEEYIAARQATVRRVSEFLGIPSCEHLIDEAAVYNRSDGKPIRSRFWGKIRRSRLYRQYLQPYLPVLLRDRVRHAVVPKAPPRPEPPSDKTIEFIREQLEADMKELQQLLALDAPIWPTAKKHRQEGQTPTPTSSV